MINVLLGLFIFFSFSQASIMEEFFPKLNDRIIDQGNVLNLGTKKQLSAILKEHEDQTSNKIIVVILNSLHGYEIEDFSYKLAKHWGIEEKEKSNRVLLLISLKDKKAKIEVGYDLENSLTNKILDEIIEYTLKPSFKEQNFNKAISQTINKILFAIKGEYKSQFTLNSITYKKINPYLFFSFFLIIFISMLLKGLAKVIENQKMYKISKGILTSSFISIFAISVFNLGYLVLLTFFIVFFVILKITKNINFKELKKKKTINYFNNLDSHLLKSSSKSFNGGAKSFSTKGASGGW